MKSRYLEEPWEHPDWYDLHDRTWTAGIEREPEHYQEFVIALPPLDRDDHLIDVGAGTGKLALLIAMGYPKLGKIILLDPNELKLDRALEKFSRESHEIKVSKKTAEIGEGRDLPENEATLVTVGSVLMPTMVLRGDTLKKQLDWLRQSFRDIFTMLKPGGWLYDLETLAAPLEKGGLDDPVRRLKLIEFLPEFRYVGFQDIECMYRFRDRVVIRARKPE
jgi:SAM-dependent methyltransferase